MGGRKIIKNVIRCKKCNTILESAHVHDFQWCSCEAVAVDGGHDYLRRIVNPDSEGYEDLSIHEIKPLDWCKVCDWFKNGICHRNLDKHCQGDYFEPKRGGYK